jgi:1-deoxy-D-xylulose-5-phosphate synthase
VHTQKGFGFAPAAREPESWHSAAPFDEQNGKIVAPEEAGGRPTWTRSAVDELIALAEKDERIVAITAAMSEGTGLLRFAHRFPERFFDVGICEQHAVALAAGLAKGGRRPVVGVYSTFLQRAYDQLFHEVALQGLPVVLLVDRAGLVGADGPTHHGLYDIAYMRHLPGFTLAAPADRAELAGMLRLAARADGPWAIRYPRDRVPAEALSGAPVEVGRAVILRQGGGGALLAYGSVASAALEAAERLAGEGVAVTVASARFAKPLDGDSLASLVESQPWVLTVEDHTAPGGFGSAAMEAAEARGLETQKIHRAAVADVFVEHDSRGAQLASAGLAAEQIAERARALV